MKTSVTLDSISLRGAGVVSVAQQGKGARFTLDSLLLADFCRVKSRDTVLEPGTGTGIVSLLVAGKHPRSRITAVELQPSLAALCRRNIMENGFEDRIQLIEGDLRLMSRHLNMSSFDLIIANPPYTKTGTGRQNPGQERLSSRQDRFGDLNAWLGLEQYLKHKGRYVLVYPAARLADLVVSLRSRGLEPKRIRFVHSRQNKPAFLVLTEAVKSGGRGIVVLPPLIVQDASGAYTPEMQDLYAFS